MMPLPDFEFHSPAGLDEAAGLLASHGDAAKVLAGGTDLVVAMKHGLHKPRHVVWLGNVAGVDAVAELPDGSLRFGAMCTLDAISRSPLVRRRLPKLAEAANAVASPQIRNRATLGGNLCINTRCFYYDHSEFWRGSLCGCLKLGVEAGGLKQVCQAGPGLGVCTAVFFSDMAPALIALGASVEVRGRGATRSMPLAGLYGSDGSAHLTLARGELLSAVSVPAPASNVRFSRRKIGVRGSIDFPIANVGAALALDGALKCVSGSIVIGAVETCPVDFRRGVEMLSGKTLDPALIDAVAREAAATVSPLPNAYESVGYRKKMVEVMVRRCLADLAA
jgi:4-hydroxybenzoyl-CoA reductase subunit beta